jgi:hypothetical protein
MPTVDDLERIAPAKRSRDEIPEVNNQVRA